ELRTWSSMCSTAATVFPRRATRSRRAGWCVSCDNNGAYDIRLVPPSGGAFGAGTLLDWRRGDASRPSGDRPAGRTQAPTAFERGGNEGVPRVVSGRTAGRI